MLKNILKLIAVFVIGIVGGIFADQILWPYFIERPLFYEYRLEKPPVYVTEIREITIQENSALTSAIEKVEKAIVGVRAETKKGKTYEGSGLIVTSDGLIITLAELVPSGAKADLFLDGSKISTQILKENGDLALLKVERTDLDTVGFYDFGNIKLGERVFLIGTIFGEKDAINKSVNEGIIRTFDADSIQTNIFEETTLQGSSLFNIEGQLVGLNTIDKYGRVSAISIKTIKEFLGF